MKSAEILERAADLIDERGHCKRVLVDRYGSMCALGALDVAYPAIDDQSVPAYRALQAAVGGNLLEWNDQPERTAAEVTSTLRAVAATLRAQEREPVIEPIELHTA